MIRWCRGKIVWVTDHDRLIDPKRVPLSQRTTSPIRISQRTTLHWAPNWSLCWWESRVEAHDCLHTLHVILICWHKPYSMRTRHVMLDELLVVMAHDWPPPPQTLLYTDVFVYSKPKTPIKYCQITSVLKEQKRERERERLKVCVRTTTRESQTNEQ